MKFACLVYTDEKELEALPESEQMAAIVAECGGAAASADDLKKGGHLVYRAGLLVSKFPAKITSVEVRPIMDPDGELSDPVDQTVVAAIRRQSQR